MDVRPRRIVIEYHASDEDHQWLLRVTKLRYVDMETYAQCGIVNPTVRDEIE